MRIVGEEDEITLRLVDTHAHLSDLEDREGVIRRAREAGIEAIVAVGGNLETSRATSTSRSRCSSWRNKEVPQLKQSPRWQLWLRQ